MDSVDHSWLIKPAPAGSGYAGVVTAASAQAWATGAAVLVDVRGSAELQAMPVPGALHVEWQREQAEPAVAFVAALERTGVSKRTPLLLLCRSGARSHRAADAAAHAGYTAYNIEGGVIGGASALGWAQAAEVPM
jgi:rhodanese-related sulfurtransferase